MIDLERRDDVAVVRWRDGENRFDTRSVQRWHDVLDELCSIEGPLAVVITGDGRFFSNGLDLDALAADPASAGPVVEEVHRLLGRLLLLPAYTVAALNGHTFAGGAMVACCVDARVMRADRGYWCLPEADLGLPLTPGMLAAVTSRLSVAVAAEAMNSARRYSGPEALAVGIVDEVAAEDRVLEVAVERAAAVAGKNRSVIAEHKRLLFGEAARACGHHGEAA